MLSGQQSLTPPQAFFSDQDDKKLDKIASQIKAYVDNINKLKEGILGNKKADYCKGKHLTVEYVRQTLSMISQVYTSTRRLSRHLFKQSTDSLRSKTGTRHAKIY